MQDSGLSIFFFKFYEEPINRYHCHLHFTGKKTQLQKTSQRAQGDRDPGFQWKQSNFTATFLTAIHVQRCGLRQGPGGTCHDRTWDTHKCPPIGNSPNTFRHPSTEKRGDLRMCCYGETTGTTSPADVSFLLPPGLFTEHCTYISVTIFCHLS